MKVALYARVATQRQDEQGGIALQIETLRTHASNQRHEVAENYVCCDAGYSGARLDRPGLNRLRDGVQADAFDAILVLSPDRLSRKCANLVRLLGEFERFGTPVLFAEQSFLQLDRTHQADEPDVCRLTLDALPQPQGVRT
jgi:site-specific DNA recombinase